MPLTLRHNVHWCNCAERIILLDLKSDRYFGIPSALRTAFLRTADGLGEPADEEQLRTLVRCGVLVEGPADVAFPRPACVEEPSGDYLSAPGSRARAIDLGHALLSEFRFSRALKRRPLHKIIERARKPRARARHRLGEPDALLRAIAATAEFAGLIVGAHDRCLVRALSAYSRCKELGLQSKLVFGVIAHPFEAHCWVQVGPAVLVGGFEQARLFTPILVLE